MIKYKLLWIVKNVNIVFAVNHHQDEDLAASLKHCCERDNLSAICDECIHDPDTGLCGFTDHSIDKHFNSDKESKEYYDKQ